MEINNAVNHSALSQVDQQKEAIKQKIQAKFGSKAAPKKKEIEDKSDLSTNSKKKVALEDTEFSDIKNNNPDSEDTRAKLKGLLQSGAFSFNDKERKALGEILG